MEQVDYERGRALVQYILHLSMAESYEATRVWTGLWSKEIIAKMGVELQMDEME